jgi:hypothetical protein
VEVKKDNLRKEEMKSVQKIQSYPNGWVAPVQVIHQVILTIQVNYRISNNTLGLIFKIVLPEFYIFLLLR